MKKDTFENLKIKLYLNEKVKIVLSFAKVQKSDDYSRKEINKYCIEFYKYR